MSLPASSRRTALRAGAALALVASAAVAPVASAANPIITNVHTADPAPLVVGNTLYIYAGRDEAPVGTDNFVMREWRVLSSTDAATWTDHGARANVGTFPWAGADAWASEVEPRSGKYYWYTSVNGNGAGWMDIGVAVGDSPLGPFRDAKGGPLISDSTPNSSGLNIDPTVFTDDDGQAYLYWGGYWGARAAKLKPNMIELDGPVVAPQGLANFWEAPWMFKRDGLYYLMYAANDTNGCVTDSDYACQRYATATSPLGPWTHRGVVLDRVSSTTNHAGVVQFNGQWYIVYHNANAPGGGNFRRSVAVDLLHFNADGTMRKVTQTTTGPPPNPGTDPGPGTNLAPSATASTSYVSPWESLAALNDGGTPASSADRSNLVYGSWPERGTQWVEYQWPTAKSINRMAAYWFDDDQGIDLPASCKAQYWNGSAYVDVPGQSPCGVAGNTFNTTTFTAVSTTRLRLSITSKPDFSTGVLEWQAFQA
ncbi:glycoside hydrolase family 43 protein [Amycolatopsis magusensis]|uniref:glycoside hydrolase family 43 protein n=1 Tax=Amycolatopsis magusensis TaxID=882444 RepID=UPI0024A851E9|nr:glycoside hydrolase family 43 protein [Amycolatopsis magusensis]MDI5975953.1 glycoside hydrolase family 43 protein [Amycolatopsis magusensis]